MTKENTWSYLSRRLKKGYLLLKSNDFIGSKLKENTKSTRESYMTHWGWAYPKKGWLNIWLNRNTLKQMWGSVWVQLILSRKFFSSEDLVSILSMSGLSKKDPNDLLPLTIKSITTVIAIISHIFYGKSIPNLICYRLMLLYFRCF